MTRPLAKSPFVVLALGLWILASSASWAGDDDPKELSKQIYQLYQEGKYQEAIPIAEKAVELAKRVRGAEDPETATSLNDLGALYRAIGEYAKAEPILQAALQIRQRVFGKENPITAASLNNLAVLYEAMGEYAKAEPLLQETLEIKQKVLAKDDLSTAATLDDLAWLYSTTGERTKAEPLYQEALAIRQRVLGPEHLETARSLNNLAALYQEMGDYASSAPLYQKALEIRQKALGPNDPNTATNMNDLAALYYEMGDYGKAEPLYLQALAIRQKVLGPEHPGTAATQNNLALLYKAIGEYSKAESLYQQALAIRQKLLGPEDPETANSLNNLAMLYEAMGDFAKAEPLYQQALAICKKTLGPEHPYTAISLGNLAALYSDVGDFAKAEPLYQQALAICKKTLGLEHPYTAKSLNNLAELYREMGDYSKAEPLFAQALEIKQKMLGREHPGTATVLNNLASLCQEMGDYADAESLYQKALEIRQKALGREHIDTASSLNNLANLYLATRDYAKAEPLLKEALAICQKVLGQEHPDTATSLDNLAELYQAIGDFAKAEPLFQQALQIRQKVLGPQHPDVAKSLGSLALLKFDIGDLENAKLLAEDSGRVSLKVFSGFLSFTSEQQRLAYQRINDPYSLLASIPGTESDLATAILRYKGVVLDSIIEDRTIAQASVSAGDRQLLVQLNGDKKRLGRLLLQASENSPKNVGPLVDRLEAEVQQIEGELARHMAGLGQARRALTLSYEQIQKVLPKDGALLEYVRYRKYLGRNKWERRYGAIILLNGGSPVWISLGKADEIDSLIEGSQKAGHGKKGYQQLARQSADDDQVEANLTALYHELWQPIEKFLPGEIKRVIISPDGQLNFVSFATLLANDKEFLAQRYDVQYVASGRDLERGVDAPSNSGVLIFANPEFNTFPPTVVDNADTELPALESAGEKDPATSGLASEKQRGIELRDMVDMRFDPLDGTQEESVALCEKFKKWQWETNLFVRTNATKAALLKVRSPYILHLATHGFFTPEAEDSQPEPKAESSSSADEAHTKAKFFKDPMHRSGLALTGANVTLKAWKDGNPLPLGNDGILTAEDVSTLDLRGTWLITLSACDTGSGEAKAGEGVMGLRRGFIQAGVQNLLMTLWSINDAATVQIMSDFYEAAHQSGSAPQALAGVQRAWLIKLRKEQGLAKAVNLAGPFIVSSQGKL